MPSRPRAKSTKKDPDLYLFATTIMVSDRKRSVAWYTEKLGFEVIQDMGHWVTVGHKGQAGLLHLCEGPEIGAPLEPGVQGMTFHVHGDFRKKCAELARNGVKFATPVSKMSWGTFAQIADPDGNVINVHPED
jgi:catechol 2,3-dioxygenase-like lactoylglutathione lyase family enzyme